VRAPVGLVGCQLELWADELEEIEPGKPESIEPGGRKPGLNDDKLALGEETLVLIPDGAIALARGSF
jgi:hypothetical protein